MSDVGDSTNIAEFTGPLCPICKHFDVDAARMRRGPFCSAFPKGIPSRIFEGLHRHLEPYPGDNGIQFEELDPKVLEAAIEEQERAMQSA